METQNKVGSGVCWDSVNFWLVFFFLIVWMKIQLQLSTLVLEINLGSGMQVKTFKDTSTPWASD